MKREKKEKEKKRNIIVNKYKEKNKCK